MKKLLAALFTFTLCLAAADFWQSKPAAEWTDKDLQKMVGNSPWAKPDNISMSGPTPPALGRAAGNSGADDTGAPVPVSEGGGGTGRGGGGSSRGGGGGGAAASGGEGGGGGGAASLTVVARWQSALPVKQAFVRLRYGAEAGTSAEAKETLEREEPNYVIVLSGTLRPFLRGNPEALKQALMDASALSVKGKAVKPVDVQIGGGQKSVDVAFIFPRSTPVTLDDKEVEFSTKLGTVALKYKFRLKDMVYNGKLEL